MLAADDPLVATLAKLIQLGDLEGLATLLSAHPSLAQDRYGDATESRTVLHNATDWPGQFPRVADTIARLVVAGAPSTADTPATPGDGAALGRQQ